MKITREADYALRITTMIAAENKQMDAKSITEKNDIPYRFALKILHKLVQNGILKSFRGVNGGYVLNRSASEISMRDVIETIDGKIAINKCLEDREACKNSGTCKVQKKLYGVQVMIEHELASISLSDILGVTI